MLEVRNIGHKSVMEELGWTDDDVTRNAAEFDRIVRGAKHGKLLAFAFYTLRLLVGPNVYCYWANRPGYRPVPLNGRATGMRVAIADPEVEKAIKYHWSCEIAHYEIKDFIEAARKMGPMQSEVSMPRYLTAAGGKHLKAAA